jgi:RIO kinase 1
VIIDLLQAVNAAANNQAEAMLTRDVNNLTNFYGQFAPELIGSRYAQEMWALFESGDLEPDTELTGQFEEDLQSADVDGVLTEIQAAIEEEEDRLERMKPDEI